VPLSNRRNPKINFAATDSGTHQESIAFQPPLPPLLAGPDVAGDGGRDGMGGAPSPPNPRDRQMTRQLQSRHPCAEPDGWAGCVLACAEAGL